MTEAWPLQKVVLLDCSLFEVAAWTGYAVPDWIRGLPNVNTMASYTLVIGDERIRLSVGDVFAEVWEVLMNRDGT